jgi:hypothetical protein
MPVVRWHFTDPVTDEEWTVPRNPNTMTSPHPVKSRQTMPAPPGAPSAINIATQQAPVVPFEWTFGGDIRTEEHYDQLLAWSQKNRPILVTDHYGRTWRVIPVTLDVEELRPTARNLWRLRYRFSTLMLGGVP